MEPAFKFLASGCVGRFSGFAWPGPGEWVEAEGPLQPCRSGIHGVGRDRVCEWLDDELWRVELDGDLLRLDGVIVARRGRLVSRVDAWNADAATDFARACAERLRERAGAVALFGPYAQGAAAAIGAGTRPRLAAVVSYSARRAAGLAEHGGWDAELRWQASLLADRVGL